MAADGLTEERLIAQMAHLAMEALGADVAAVYLQPEQPSTQSMWRLAGHAGGEFELLAMLPVSLGTGAGVLAPLFQSVQEIIEPDLLDGADDDAPLPPRLPARSFSEFSNCVYSRRDSVMSV